MSFEICFDPDVFHGELTANRAQVFVRASRTADFADCTLQGFVHGPRCEYAHTLPAKYALTDLGAGPTLLARATITDPCLWTSDLPQIYDVHIELRRSGEVLASEKRMIGLRGIGARSSGEMVREGKVWVPRGVAIEHVQQDLSQLRTELLAAIVSAPPLDLLVEASRQGVYLIVPATGTQESLSSTLRNLARWPAVMMVVIRDGEALDRGLQQVAPNLVLAQLVSWDDVPRVRPAPWANAVVIEFAEPTLPKDVTPTMAATIQSLPLPVFVRRGMTNPAIGPRAECDRLQRDLASMCQFAGCLIAAS